MSLKIYPPLAPREAGKMICSVLQIRRKLVVTV